MRTEAEIREEIARVEALAEKGSGWRTLNWTVADIRRFEAAALEWVLETHENRS